MMRLIKITAIVMFSLSLFACASEQNMDPHAFYENHGDAVKGAAVGAGAGAATGFLVPGVGLVAGAIGGAAIGGVVGYYLDQHKTVADSLSDRHVQVIRIGDYTRLIIPSNQLFVGQGSQLLPSATQPLDMVLKLIKAVPKIRVDVAAYTYKMGSQRIDAKLTQLQAQAVANYLWDNGLDARFVTARGMGYQNRITNDPQKLNEDYRVEITLKALNPKLPG